MTANETIKAIEVASKLEALFKRAENKERILLDDHVELFRKFNRIQIALWLELNKELEEIRDTLKGTIK